MNSIRCRQCEHYIEINTKEGKLYGCDRSKCVFEPATKSDSKFCPDRKAKTTNMETILHCIENDCVAYKDGKCLKYNSEQEPTTKNDLGVDCISRADAIQAMQNKAKKLTNEDTINGLCGAVAILFELPSVTSQLSVPEVTALAEWIAKLTEECENAYNKGYADGMKAQAEPKTGHWININVDGFLYHKIYKCSHCGDTVCEHPENIQKYKYCSNCGAKMESEE